MYFTALAASPVPAYCNGRSLISAPLTPSQWQACWVAGWHQPATTAQNAGYFAGHNVVPWALLIGVIIGLLWIASRASSRKTAASN